jgi:hypothetical protein
MSKLLLWLKTYERHLSALAMVAGFIVDNLVFTRIDLWRTQALFAGYTAACFLSIPLLHFIETRIKDEAAFVRVRLVLRFTIQFALGGFWSGFVIFYGRSAVLGASWPFLLFLFLVFLGSEYFHKYHARLVFTSVLFFFALYSYAIFLLPLYTGTLGTLTFLGSGVVAICLFALFTILLRLLARERFMEDVWRIRTGAALVLFAINIFYFTNILPPLPLSAEAVGVYHSVWRVPGAYLAKEEPESFGVKYLGAAPTLHITPGESVFAYSSIFAPTALTTTVEHRWSWYDPVKKQWILRSTIAYPIAGGRDGGYRGYSAVPITDMGQWRVDVITADGRLIARMPFVATPLTAAPVERTITLK